MTSSGNIRKYKFNWELLGDLSVGRPNLGNSTRVEIYRLMQFTFRDVLEIKFGPDTADEIFCEAGRVAGKEFYNHFLAGAKDVNSLVRLIQDASREYGVGIFKVEKADERAQNLIVTMSEDLDCSGLPEIDTEVCKYDEGFIAGIMEAFTGKQYNVKEIDCWCTGDRTCRFSVDIAS
jgi:predicted hydrocarbon binding protein